MSEQSPQSPASAPKKPWYMKWWVWAIAAVLVVGGINAVINPSQGNLSGAPQPTQSVPAEPTASETPAQPGVEVIYAANEAINNFVVAFNKTHPAQALAAGDLTVYHHHGSDHENQVKTQINGAEVVISEDTFSHGTYGVSVVWDNPTQGAADANLAMFHTLLEVVVPNLSEADVDARWQQVLDGPTVKWDDGTEATPGPLAINNVPGAFSYVKLYG